MAFAEWRPDMNLTNFLKQTDALTAQYTTEQLIAFIHDIGRIYPEHRREDFLEMLQSVGNKAGEVLNKNEAKNIDFDEMYSHIRESLKALIHRKLLSPEY